MDKLSQERKDEILALAKRAYGKEFASKWMNGKSRMFKGRSPKTMANTQADTLIVTAFLNSLLDGTEANGPRNIH